MNILDRRAVYSFLNTLYNGDNDHKQKNGRLPVERRRKSPDPRRSNRLNTATVCPSNSPAQQQQRTSSNHGHQSRASRRDLGEVLESLER